MPDEFYGDETFLTSHETSSFSLLTMSAKVTVLNVMKLPSSLYSVLPLNMHSSRNPEHQQHADKLTGEAMSSDGVVVCAMGDGGLLCYPFGRLTGSLPL